MKCDSPFYVLPKAGTEKVPVPCGKCPPCKQRRVNQWVFRLLQEKKNYLDCHFVTLTYDTQHVPITPNGFMTLRKKDFQDYIKRLRKLCSGRKLKYYVAGEYGSQNHRPHYHAIVFGVPDSSFFADAWTVDGVPIGGIHIGTVSNDSIAYTMKYIDKSNFQRRHSRDDRQPEFSLMSKGMGKNYVEDPQVVEYHRADLSRNYVTHVGGVRVSMPRYYRDRIYTEQERKEQVRLIEDSELRSMEKLREEHACAYPNGKIDFFTWLEQKKYDRYRSFYSRQALKPRSL